jgi:hypothetical protein
VETWPLGELLTASQGLLYLLPPETSGGTRLDEPVLETF